MDQSLRFDCAGDDTGQQPSPAQQVNSKTTLLAEELKRMKTVYQNAPPPKQLSSSAMIHTSGSPIIGRVNIGDGYLSVMLSVTEAKLALLPLMTNQADYGGFLLFLI